LEILGLQDSKIDETGLKNLAAVTSLKSLDLKQNQDVTDEGVRHLEALKNLQSLNLSLTGVTDQAVKYLQKALPQCEIIK